MSKRNQLPRGRAALPASPCLDLSLDVLAGQLVRAGLLTLGLLAQARAQSSAAPAAATLPEVKVAAPAAGAPAPLAGGQLARGARLGLLGDSDTMKSPFGMSSYTARAIEDRQAATAADVVAQDPSVRMTGQTGGILDAFFIRGFPIGEGNLGEVAFDGMYGVAPNYRILSDYVERVEVLKGPGALLYGMSPNSGIGGVINIVPKRAQGADRTRVSVDHGSRSQAGAHLDLSRRFGADRQWGVRVNASRDDGATPVDKQSRTATVGAVALDYAGERLRATLDLLDQKEHFDAPSRPFMLGAGVPVPAAPNGRRNVTQSWEWADIGDRSWLLRGEYDLSDKLVLFGGVGAGRTRVDRVFGTPTIVNTAGDTSSRPDHFQFDIARSSAELGLRGRFDVAGLRHTVTLQTSSYRDQLQRGSVNGTAVASNINLPVDRPVQSVAAPATVPKLSETELGGWALADTLSTAGETVLFTMGLRQQKVRSDNFSATSGAVTSSYDKSAVTPMLGLVVRPWSNVSLYANTIQGLSKGDIAPGVASNAGEVFAPYKARQQEVGVKVEHGRLISTVSLFQITKPSGQLTGTLFAIDAEQRNRGLEVSTGGELATGLRVMGGATFLDAVLTRTSSVATLGKRPIGVPTFQANLGMEWDTPWWPGFALTGAVAHTGRQFVDSTNTRSLPAWNRLDLGARYTTKVAGRATTLRATVFNAQNRDYWAGVASYGAIVQGAPRTLRMSATVDF